jgi:methionyl-tRNA synthetase
MGRTYYITTAIDYANAGPHLGHAYEKVLADVLARVMRLRGRDVYFLTGVDQHGQKVQIAAGKAGVDPAEFVAANTAKFRALWETLGVRYDGWAETTAPVHKRVVRSVLSRLHAEGKLYQASYSGFYSVRQEQFLTDKERGPDGQFGPEWGEVVEIEEKNWYFKLAEHRDWLLGFLRSHPQCVFPSYRHQELLNAAGLLNGDLSISRPKSRLSWGIEFPFDPEYVTFVWFDALINYISFAGYLAERGSGLPDFEALWPADAHVVGKDILSPAHGIYWLIMLHALGFRDEDMPRLVVHGFWNMAGAKMSKSLGNLADPVALASAYGADALRYYLMRDIATGQDADFNEERLVVCYNSELANSVGNLLNRTLNMAERYRAGRLCANHSCADGDALRTAAAKLVQKYERHMNEFQVHAALNALIDFSNLCNATIESTAPWKLAKDGSQSARLDAVLYGLAESLRIISILLSAIIPESAAKMGAQLGVDIKASRITDTRWGVLKDGHQLGKAEPVFPRLEAKPSRTEKS